MGDRLRVPSVSQHDDSCESTRRWLRTHFKNSDSAHSGRRGCPAGAVSPCSGCENYVHQFAGLDETSNAPLRFRPVQAPHLIGQIERKTGFTFTLNGVAANGIDLLRCATRRMLRSLFRREPPFRKSLHRNLLYPDVGRFHTLELLYVSPCHHYRTGSNVGRYGGVCRHRGRDPEQGRGQEESVFPERGLQVPSPHTVLRDWPRPGGKGLRRAPVTLWDRGKAADHPPPFICGNVTRFAGRGLW